MWAWRGTRLLNARKGRSVRGEKRLLDAHGGRSYHRRDDVLILHIVSDKKIERGGNRRRGGSEGKGSLNKDNVARYNDMVGSEIETPVPLM